MASKLFLDANVLFDLSLEREGYTHARQIVEAAIAGHINLFTSSSIIHILGHWLTKASGPSQARKLVLSLLEDVYVLETNHESTVAALHSKINDIEDAIQYQTDIYHQLDLFISSRDKLLKKMSSHVLPIYTPEELLKTL